MKRKIVAPFDITKLKRCPYCSSTDIDVVKDYNPMMKQMNKVFWRCNYCGESWDECDGSGKVGG